MNDIQTLADIVGMTASCIESGKLVFVVRCKDCKYYSGQFCNKIDIYPWPNDDFFCANGERKE